MSLLIQGPAAKAWERRSILQRLSLRRALERERLTSLLDHLVKLQIVSIAGSDSSSARPTSTAGHPRAETESAARVLDTAAPSGRRQMKSFLPLDTGATAVGSW